MKPTPPKPNKFPPLAMPVFKVVPLAAGFAPGVNPDNLKEILNDMDVAAYLEQERGSQEPNK